MAAVLASVRVRPVAAVRWPSGPTRVDRQPGNPGTESPVVAQDWYRTRSGRCQFGSGGNQQLIPQELGREIRAVRPHQRVQLRVDFKPGEIALITLRFEHFSREFGGQVNSALEPVTEQLRASSGPDDLVQALDHLRYIFRSSAADLFADSLHGQRADLADLDP